MSAWKQKRFWTDTTVHQTQTGFEVLLDARKVKTPAKAELVVPTKAMASAIADEWQAQSDVVNPNTMPVTRSANAAIDKVAHQHTEVADMIAAYGDADLLCYRADAPEELVIRQATAWDPPLDWAAKTYGARLCVRSGVMHAPQDGAALTLLSAQTHALNPFQLAAFHDLVSLSGSLVLGLAATRDYAPIDDLWALSRVDEIWQVEQWGPDEDAETLAEIKRQAFVHAKRFFDMC